MLGRELASPPRGPIKMQWQGNGWSPVSASSHCPEVVGNCDLSPGIKLRSLLASDRDRNPGHFPGRATTTLSNVLSLPQIASHSTS